MKTSRAPLILAIILLLLPVLYVGSYLALVDPLIMPGMSVTATRVDSELGGENYRIGGDVAARIFWPLEQFDRRVRPGAWSKLWDEEMAREFGRAGDNSRP